MTEKTPSFAGAAASPDAAVPAAAADPTLAASPVPTLAVPLEALHAAPPGPTEPQPSPAPFPAPFPSGGPVTSGQRRTPVVGIGASAGGLEALEAFFGHVPPASGLAFVVVQHLDPAKESILPELLQRSALIPVVQLVDRTAIEPNHVYVAPPGFEVTVLHGVLHLLRPVARGQRLPIDFFLRSLAVDQQANAAGVILSGMGSDGTLGLRALKEKAGGVFVQAPDTARFPSMPASAVDAGLADVVAAPEELPARIVAYFDHPLQAANDGRAQDKLNSALEKVLILVRAQTGHDFSLYKKSTVYRRIQRRMAIHQLDTVEEYVQYVRQNAVEADLLFKELLIGVTCFFRDPEVWQHLRTEVLPKLIQARPDGGTLRAWVAACSTGEEAYSLAITFAEVIEDLAPEAHYALQIFATDLDSDAIAKARTGFYADNIAGDIPPERLRKFFSKVPGGYRVGKLIRSMVIFAQQSIASDPPFAKLDILTCRNLMIYLEPALQRALLQMFHGSLVPGGLLVLGSAETIGQAADLFAPVDVKARIFRRIGGSVQRAVNFPVQGNGAASGGKPGHATPRADPEEGLIRSRPSMQTLADQVLLRRFCPAAVLVTSKGDIVYFSGKTGKYLEPPAGKANLNLFAMARRGLSQPLSEVFYQVVRQKIPVQIEEVTLEDEDSRDGGVQRIRVAVEPLAEPSELAGLLLVVFTDLPAGSANASAASLKGDGSGSQEAAAADARVVELTQALARSREENQSTREEMQTSQEELKSANEELQSANEELTTSREEMQSMNEELQTVNSELQGRVDALARASDDMENLLNSTDIATLFLDDRLHVRRFTTRTTSLIKLIPTDVGRPITDIVSDLDYPHLARDAEEVLRTLMFKEIEVSAGPARWYKARVMPYRTQDNRIDGVVLTFADISAAKKLEATLRSANKDQA